MGSSTHRIADDKPPVGGERATSHQARKPKKRHRRREGQLAKARKGIVGLVFALQLIAALLGLVLVPLYLVYEFIVR